MSQSLRPRYGRLAALSASVVVTGTALLGGAGLLPASGHPSYAASRGPEVPKATHVSQPPSEGVLAATYELPVHSGEGRRVVFDESEQRVWLVRGDGSVLRTYLVSGSMFDNLQPGSYQVYSRSMHATGIEDSGTMRYMVRFAHGETAAIGFHDIPVHNGARVQTRAELGTPLSHGCIRQWRPDAKALWGFAPLGTEVVVTA